MIRALEGAGDGSEQDMMQRQERSEGAGGRAAEMTVAAATQLTLSIAKRLERSVPVAVDREYLLTAGWTALRRCVASYDPASGVPFLASVKSAVRGAMLDALPQVGDSEGDLYSLFRQLEALAEDVDSRVRDADPEMVPLKLHKKTACVPRKA